MSQRRRDYLRPLMEYLAACPGPVYIRIESADGYRSEHRLPALESFAKETPPAEDAGKPEEPRPGQGA